MSLSLDRSLLKPVATVVAIVLSLFQIYFTGGFGVTDAHILRGTHLTLIMILVLLLVPSRKLAPGEKEGWFPILIDLALIALAIAINVYVFQEADNISRRLKYVEDVTNLDLFYGTGLVLLVLEATRRTSGWPLVIVSGSFLAYAMFGEYMPGGLAHNGIEYDRLIEQLFLLTDGIYGVPLGAAAGMIFAFVMFGAFLESSKMSSLFMDLACLLTRKSAGGPAKVSIFASALFGTISGSAAANVYGTGTFTIPLMKKVGYTPHFAGAVEAVASTGGQMMPPIMGAAAFIMADVIGVSYLTIAKAALIPSVLYYLTLLAIIHLEAVSKNMGTLPPRARPQRGFGPAPPILPVPVGFSDHYSAHGPQRHRLRLLRHGVHRDPQHDPFRNALHLQAALRRAGTFGQECHDGFLLLRLRGHHHRRHQPDRHRLQVHQRHHRARGQQPFAAHGHADGHLHHPRHGRARRGGLCHRCGRGGPGAHGRGRDADGGAHVLLVLRLPLQHHAAGRHVVLCGGGHCAFGSDPHVPHCGKARPDRIHPALLFLNNPLLLYSSANPALATLWAFATACLGVSALAAGLQGWLFGPCNSVMRGLLLVAAFLAIDPGLKTDLAALALCAVAGVWSWKERGKG